MSFAENLRLAINNRLSVYQFCEGGGPDAYCAEKMLHPMAEGKFLQVLAVLRRTTLISAAQAEQWTADVCARLEASALSYCHDGWCWGLGFAWRNLLPTEPFLITSAIITRGALECRRVGFLSEGIQQVSERGILGLSWWLRNLALDANDMGCDLPAYSPGIREPIYNAAAYAYGTLSLAEQSGVTPSIGSDWQFVLERVLSRRIGGIGWEYSPTNHVIDLLHQCYILNAMVDAFGAVSIEDAATEMVGQFAGPCCFADAMRLIHDGEDVLETRDIPWLRPFGTHRLELLPKPARLWSLGELLVLLSRLGRDGRRREAWTRLGRRIAEAILLRLSTSDDVEATYPRHVMHALHGLACYLELLREQAKFKTAAPPSQNLK